ncbi:MAG: sigma-70 family RNA polymerase sigma factor [Chloroflexi bacterium]|nr:sigma-70 family RNA polymerase sigma factor [Chloroflexota bacterium]
MTSTAEAGLIKRCKDGEESAWEELYGTYRGQVTGILSWGKWRLSKEEIEDLSQEIFLELSRCLGKFRGDSSLSTFIGHITKNRCISHIRKVTALKRPREDLSSFRKDDPEENSPYDPPDQNPGPEETVISALEIRAVRDTIRQMDPECRKVLNMRYFKDLPYDKISETLGVPIGTVCSRLKRCILKFRTLMEQKKPALRPNR